MTEAAAWAFAEPQDAPPPILGCPNCGQTDMVMPVPEAVRLGGRIEPAAPKVKYNWTAVSVGFFGAKILSFLIHLVSAGSATAVSAAFFLCCLAFGARSARVVFKERERIGRGRSAAYAVWKDGWFCSRCGLMYFQPGYEPRGLLLHHPLSRDEFQHLVYSAGGYPDLSAVGKATAAASAPPAPAARRWWPFPPVRRARRR